MLLVPTAIEANTPGEQCNPGRKGGGRLALLLCCLAAATGNRTPDHQPQRAPLRLVARCMPVAGLMRCGGALVLKHVESVRSEIQASPNARLCHGHECGSGVLVGAMVLPRHFQQPLMLGHGLIPLLWRIVLPANTASTFLDGWLDDVAVLCLVATHAGTPCPVAPARCAPCS